MPAKKIALGSVYSDALATDLSRRMLALSNPVRVHIVHILSHGEMEYHALEERLKSSTAILAVSLNILIVAGLVAKRREGAGRIVFATPMGREMVEMALGSVRSRVAAQSLALGLAGPQPKLS